MNNDNDESLFDDFGKFEIPSDFTSVGKGLNFDEIAAAREEQKQLEARHNADVIEFNNSRAVKGEIKSSTDGSKYLFLSEGFILKGGFNTLNAFACNAKNLAILIEQAKSYQATFFGGPGSRQIKDLLTRDALNTARENGRLGFAIHYERIAPSNVPVYVAPSKEKEQAVVITYKNPKFHPREQTLIVFKSELYDFISFIEKYEARLK